MTGKLILSIIWSWGQIERKSDPTGPPIYMPKLYEYLGLIIFFYSNEHEPVHVHARYQDYESKIEIILHEGKILKLNILQVAGKKPLPSAKLKDFKNLVSKLSDEIVQQWVSYFVYNKKIVTKKIQGKI